ncbi:hypothetical protein [Euzebya rosea]|uniref:hypothetical protein n=1 Tax=Euzebya rosea TaxID=2052804 RepID=UPI001300920C|nr:hypothetical protein [Euzebya rosea]
MRPPPLDRRVVLRQPWAIRSAGASALIVLVAMAIPGTIAIVLVPENPREGWLAVTLAVVIWTWLAARWRSAAIVLDPDALRRPGPRPPSGGPRVLAWAEVDELRWETVRGGGRRPVTTHLLHAISGDRRVRLTRYPASDSDRTGYDQRLRDAGVVTG